MADDTRSTPGIEMLLGRGEERGCVSESEIDRLAETLELDDEGVEDVRDRLSKRGIAVQDDCGKPAVPATSYANGDLCRTRSTRWASSCARRRASRC